MTLTIKLIHLYTHEKRFVKEKLTNQKLEKQTII